MILSNRSIPYVQSAGSQDVPPPYHFPRVTVNAFIWEAQMASVQQYCDRFFNLGEAKDRGFVYKAAAFWPYAMLLFLDYPEMISSNPTPQDTGEVPYCDRGVTSQREVFVALPVMRYGVGASGLFTASELEWVLPYIAVSEPWSCVCGREMLGLGKLLGKIETGEAKFVDSFCGTVAMRGWREMRTGVMQETLPFLKITTGPALPTFRTSPPERSLATLFESRQASWVVESLGALSNFVDTMSMGLVPTTMRTVGLKQYRDAADPERAVYQALVTCRSRYTNLSSFKLYDENDVCIAFNDLGSFSQILDVFLDTDMLGKVTGDCPEVKENNFVKTPAVAAFRFEADVDYDTMRVIHEFAIDNDHGHLPTPARSDIVARWFRPWKGFFGPGGAS